MQRTHNAIITLPITPTELWLPEDLIVKIATCCEPNARIMLSLVNTLFNRCASIRKENGQLLLNKADRLFYLFYGCLHNLKNLVTSTLNYFDTELISHYTLIDGTEIPDYSDRVVLNDAIYHIKQFTDSDATKLLYNYIKNDNILYSSIRSPVVLAIKNQDNALLSLLLKEPNIDINELCWLNKTALEQLLYFSSLKHASKSNDLNTAKIILAQKNIDLKTRAREILIQALVCPSELSLEVIKHILAQDAININQRYNGQTILHELCDHSKHDVKILSLLLTHSDMDINIKNFYGKTLLHSASESSNINAVKILLDSEANVNIQDCFQNTPLHIAIDKQNISIVQILLTHSTIDVDLKNCAGHTPFELAHNIHCELLDECKQITTQSSVSQDLLQPAIDDLLERIKQSNTIIKILNAYLIQ
jgi:ankyrin repeat protein